MHGVLALFEGVATGAADGYARMAGRPAATLLHLGPGLGNGLANLHNARRAHSPVVNIVGDHAIGHRIYDAQLQSDIETVARNVSTFVRTAESTPGLGLDAAAAVAAAVGPPGSVATLILPADVSWSEGGVVAGSGRRPSGLHEGRRERPDEAVVARRGGCAALRRALGGPHRRTGLHRPRLRPGGRPRRLHRGHAAGRDVPGPTGAGGGAAAGGAAGLPGRVHRPAARGGPAPGAGRRGVPGLVLRLPGQGQRPGAARLHRPSAGRTGRRRRRRGGGAGRAGGGRARIRATAPRSGPRACPPVRSTAASGVPGARRAAARRGHRRPTRATPRASSPPGPPPAPLPTTGCV